MDGRFEGKTALITGGAGGIGRATALRLAREGARIVLVDLDAVALVVAAAPVREAGAEVLTLEADVRHADEVERYVERATEHFGGIDVFFNNAGIEGTVHPLTEYPEELFDRVIAINLKGVWLGMKYVVPGMIDRGGGSIVNTSSVAGLGATPGIVAYGASKHAVVGMTKTASLEFGDAGVRVNAVCPSPINTQMMRRLEASRTPDSPETTRRQYEQRNPMARYGEAEEGAALVTFLLSDDASYINGAIYNIDGGGRAR